MREGEPLYPRTRGYRDLVKASKGRRWQLDPVTKERRKEPDVLEKPERKAAARDVSTLLTGTSEPTRRNIGKDAIVSFFQSLNPDRRQLADDQDLMWIGKTLYEFRPLEKDDKPPEMTEQEKRLIKLACRLLEDAFYDGRLANMYERDAASVAFIVNTIAKIFDVREYRNELKDTFEAKKFRFFTYDVERFEAQALFPDTDGEKGREIKEEGFADLQNKIDAEVARLVEMAPKREEQHFAHIATELHTALPILREDAGIDKAYLLDVEVAVRFFLDQAPQMRRERDLRAALLHVAAKDPHSVLTPEEPQPLRPTDSTYAEFTLATAEHVIRKDGTKKRIRAIIAQGPEVKKVPPERGTTVLDKVALRLGRLFGMKGNEYVPTDAEAAARDVIRRFVSEPIGENYARYLNEHGHLSSLVQTRRELRTRDEPFKRSLGVIMKDREFQNNVPYMIKTCLIADDMLQKSNNERTLFKDAALARYDEDKIAFKTYDLLGDPEARTERTYSAMHYDPRDMVFALWAVKFLRSKRKK